MKKLILFLLLAVGITACGTDDKSELYDMAKKELLERLKSPSSAVFHELGEDDIAIKDSMFARTMLEQSMPSMYEKYKKNPDALLGDSKENDETFRKLLKDTVYVDYAILDLHYEAQNSFGAMLKNKKRFYFERANYFDGSGGTWKFLRME